MHRRELVAAIASVGVIGAGGVLARRGPPSLEAFDDSSSDADPDGGRDGSREPIEIETIDAPGSEAGTVRVPDPGRVAFVDFFATWCTPCQKQMAALADAVERVPDDVLFLSVTAEPVGRTISEAELVAWWDEHDGNWPLGLDPTAELGVRYDAGTYPTAVTIDAEGDVQWSHTGVLEAETIVDRIEDAIDASDESS